MYRFSIFPLALFLWLDHTPVARALTTVPRAFDQLVNGADTVFKGTVSAKESRWIGQGAERHIVTLVTFQVHETYKGTPASAQTLRFFGGTVGRETMAVPDMPRFELGQEAVLFVVNNGRQFCPLVGIAQGRFQVVADAATGRERVWTNAGSPVVDPRQLGQSADAEPSRPKTAAESDAPAMTAEDFRSAILEKVAAQAR